MKADRSEDVSAALTTAVAFPTRDVRTIKPVSDPVFQAWRSLYSFDRGNLQAQVRIVENSAPEWRVEQVSYAAAYGGERIPAYLFLPNHVRPPYQAVVVFPGANVVLERSSARLTAEAGGFNYIVRSGRAVLYPIYKSTFERSDGLKNVVPNMSASYRDHMIMWAKDVGRSIDYLEQRPDIVKEKIGLLGLSWGAELAPLILAVEPRLSLGLICLGALSLQPALPEADPVNFAPRAKVPVLMLNGRFDYYSPVETTQDPLFKLLGSPAEHKRRVIYETGHAIPRNAMIREVVGWMDKYWGQTSR